VAAIDESTAAGVSFALSEEQKELRRLAREFAAKEIRPKEAEYDEKMQHPADVVAKAHELGLMNLHIPEEYGGLGLSAFDGLLVGEELYWGCSGMGTSITANGLGAGPVIMFGSDEQKARWLPPLIESPILASFGLSEPNAGSDVAALKTSAVREGDEYVLNGSKTFITNAGYAQWSVVFAKTDPKAGHRGMSAFVVPMDAPGVTIEKHLDKMGQRATDTSAFALQDVRVPVANRLGEEGDGFKVAMATLDFTRPGTAIGAVGVAQAAYEHAVEYAKERVAFDLPIAMHQGVNFMVADMATEIQAARLLCWQAAWMLDQGYGREATLYSSFAKRFAADTAMKVATDAVQVFGGYGYIKEYPVEKLMRDAKLFQIYEGTSQIQRLVIAKEVFLPSGGSSCRRARGRRTAFRRADRLREPIGHPRRPEGARVDAGMLRVAVGHGLVAANDRVLVAEARAAKLAAAGVDDELVVEAGRDPVAAEGFEHDRLDPVVAEGLVAARERAQVLDARHLEPDEVGGVVGDPLRVGVGEPDAHRSREREALHVVSIST
jgi:acyl-CoA dehydrogenase